MVSRIDNQKSTPIENSSPIEARGLLSKLSTGFNFSSQKKNSKKQGFVKKEDRFCKRCHRLGQVEETYFKKHSFPEWFKERKDKQASVNVVASFSSVDSSAFNSFFEMFQRELQKYMKLPTTKEDDNPLSVAYFADFAGNFTSSSSEKSSLKRIVDSGASNHVYGVSTFLTNLRSPPTKNTFQLHDGPLNMSL